MPGLRRIFYVMLIVNNESFPSPPLSFFNTYFLKNIFPRKENLKVDINRISHTLQIVSWYNSAKTVIVSMLEICVYKFQFAGAGSPVWTVCIFTMFAWAGWPLQKVATSYFIDILKTSSHQPPPSSIRCFLFLLFTFPPPLFLDRWASFQR